MTSQEAKAEYDQIHTPKSEIIAERDRLKQSHAELLEALKLAVYKATFPAVESGQSTRQLLNEVIRKAELI